MVSLEKCKNHFNINMNLRSKNDRSIVPDDRVKLDVTGDTVTLTISEAAPSDAGTYELVAENAVGSIDCTAKLTVHCMLNILKNIIFFKLILAPPVIVNSTPSPINVSVGQVLYISCEVTGYPRPDMIWKPANDRARTEQSDIFITITEISI